MAVKPVIDHGQELALPEGQAIGFVDTKEQCDGKRCTNHMAATLPASIRF
jgi:hypothetical protein